MDCNKQYVGIINSHICGTLVILFKKLENTKKIHVIKIDAIRLIDIPDLK